MIRRALSELGYRTRRLFRRAAVERELDVELRFHLERETEKLVREGMSPGEARRQAGAAFGGLERIKDDTRDAHGVALLESFGTDLRYGFRALKAHPAFTFGVVATLALGIGANATMFGIVDRLIFRPPPSLQDPATVHRLYRFTADNGERRVDRNFSYATFLDLQHDLKSFSAIAAFQTNRLAIGDADAVREVPVTAASANYFDFFSARPVAGRFFTAAEDVAPQGASVAVLGYGYWQTEFGGRDVLGKTIRVGSVAATIIGVAPPGFVGMSDQGVPAAYIPITTYAYSLRASSDYPGLYGWSWLEMIGRRKSEVSAAAATAELGAGFIGSWARAYAIAARFGKPEDQHISAAIAPVQMSRGPQADREARVATWIAGVALIVLLIACANVTNLLLSRAVHRRREIAVRLALGAGGGRLTRQLLTESLLLALLGAVSGLALAQWGAAGLRRWFLPADLEVGVLGDGRTLAFAGIVTLVVALATGLAPALRTKRVELTGDLKSGTRGAGTQHAGLRTGLLIFQVALSVILLVGAGLFVRSLGNASARPMGYDVDHLLYATMRPRGVKLNEAENAALAERLKAATLSVPGVVSATRAQSVPFVMNDVRSLTVPGSDSVDARGKFIYQVGAVDYFKTTGTRILRGRPFDASDTRGAAPVVVVSEGMARAIWGARGKEAIGQCLQFTADDPPRRCMTVIGIAEEMHLRLFDDAREFAYYVPEAQDDGPYETPRFLVRTAGQAAELADAVRRRLQTELPGAAYAWVTPMGKLVEPNLRSWRLGATMFAAFGALALLIAAVGLYSLVAYDVAQRTRELSVRRALGAPASRLLGWVVARATRMIGLGLGLGAGVAAWFAPALKTQLFREDPRDPAVFVVVIATLVTVGVAAALIPALRAARVDPNEVLRSD